jgi:hypothetical protein
MHFFLRLERDEVFEPARTSRSFQMETISQ